MFSCWQRENFGKSRYVAFRQLVSGAFGDHHFQGAAEELVTDFAALVEDIYAQATPTTGFQDLVQSAKGVPLFVASGSEQTQLRSVFDRNGMAKNFRGVFGSPTAKVDIVRGIAGQIRASRVDAQLLMVGDAHADADAAAASDVDFVFVSSFSLVVDSMRARSIREGFPSVVDLAELADLVNAANGKGRLR
jgi:phosphoglycolate phosphatase-like HAD superfamily hydrolase